MTTRKHSKQLIKEKIVTTSGCKAHIYTWKRRQATREQMQTHYGGLPADVMHPEI